MQLAGQRGSHLSLPSCLLVIATRQAAAAAAVELLVDAVTNKEEFRGSSKQKNFSPLVLFLSMNTINTNKCRFIS